MTIEEQISNIDWNNHKQVIDFYEKNLIYFENYQLISDEDKISDIIDIKLNYANSLFEKSHYAKTLKVIEQVDELLTKLTIEHWNFEDSERFARFLKGMVYGNTKRFRESYSIFKELIIEDPDHHYYQNWYNYSKLGLYNWIFNGITIIGIAFLVVDLLFPYAKNLPYDIGIIGIVIMLASYLAQQGLKKYFQRKKTATKSTS